MPFIYDTLVATLISMTVLLILSSIQTEATQSNTARTSRNVAKTQAQDFSTWLEEDLGEIGKNMSSNAAAFQTHQDSTKWHTTEFTFKYETVSGTLVRTRYELEKAGTRTVDGTTETLYEVVRSRKVGSGSWQQKGQSPANLGYFEVNKLDKNATPVSNPSEVESIRVRFSVIAPFQSEETFLRRVRRSAVIPYE
ncbi:MAG: hypothetical protein ABEL04_00730 [Salinibacter sp.]|uniref:hypothetical protein n=1 Tax=Salinibacter sp. TaxID=2065818 RepID=UPI0035D4496F